MTPIDQIAQNTALIAHSLSRPEQFWDTQWFATLVGALSALLVTYLVNFFSKRNAILNDFYKKMAQDYHICSLSSIVAEAGITLYGHTETVNVESRVIPEKTLAEKVVIVLRKRCKYWQLPYSKIRKMFEKYERLLSKIPDNCNKQCEESKLAEEYFEKIMRHVYKKTGETFWTAR